MRRTRPNWREAKRASGRARRGAAGLMATALGVSWLALSGCQGPAGPGTLAEARSAYDAERYGEALSGAERVAKSRESELADQGAYLAGLSAARAGETAKAERYLTVAAQSSDGALAADASAELGLVLREQGDHAAAARAFERAARGLRGEDRAQALLFAGIAQQRLGRWTQARTNLLAARSSTDDRALSDRIAEQLSVTGYTVQVGAFSEPGNAQRAASELIGASQAARLGPPVLVRGVDRLGRSLTLVQVGQFATFEAAIRARNRLGVEGAFIVPLSAF